ncbi:MAG: pancreas/duodenum homeobox protein 1 [Proteobacteria bacterium]|nr:pancreas/duodenum homeobox protein 1 [Pseudomonadota bacterium]MBU1736745.1 pancreas/duodenum homeobox protein 1 [Pseudomonadota bacterium]
MGINFNDLFTADILQELFPSERADEFFEALYGDVDEGVYDIALGFNGHSAETNTLEFSLNLSERPDKCLACNVTYGLPEVFSRHPIINVAGVVKKINELLGGKAKCGEWDLGSTRRISNKLYAVPLTIKLL